jgi:hypothetical protein
MGLVLYSSAVLIPQFAQQQLGWSSTLAGLVLLPGAALLLVLIPIVGRIMQFVPPKYIIATGGLVLAGSLLHAMNLVPQEDFYHFAVLRAAQTAGLSCLFVPISTAAYVTLPHDRQDDAAALFAMSRNIFGGIGISISTAVVTEDSQVHQTYLPRISRAPARTGRCYITSPRPCRGTAHRRPRPLRARRTRSSRYYGCRRPCSPISACSGTPACSPWFLSPPRC